MEFPFQLRCLSACADSCKFFRSQFSKGSHSQNHQTVNRYCGRKQWGWLNLWFLSPLFIEVSAMIKVSAFWRLGFPLISFDDFLEATSFGLEIQALPWPSKTSLLSGLLRDRILLQQRVIQLSMTLTISSVSPAFRSLNNLEHFFWYFTIFAYLLILSPALFLESDASHGLEAGGCRCFGSQRWWQAQQIGGTSLNQCHIS